MIILRFEVNLHAELMQFRLFFDISTQSNQKLIDNFLLSLFVSLAEGASLPLEMIKGFEPILDHMFCPSSTELLRDSRPFFTNSFDG